MSKKTLIALLTAIAVLAIAVSSVGAITDGELDGEDHPHVVLLLMEVGGEPMYRCSGTLLSPTVLLTAGHCTSNYPDEPFSGMRVFTESDVENGANSYPYAGNNSVEAVSWAAHPGYETEDPFYFHDVGIVVLAEHIELDVYGELPELDQFDGLVLPSGKSDKTKFTSVGYGQQAIFTDEAQWELASERIRMVANPFLLQLNVEGITGDYSMLLSNNHSTGGTCFGDSGGPNFLGDTNIVAGVTSFGMNQNCAGIGGVFRTDRADVLDFIDDYYTPPAE
ncbi:trypsin-like serine protease [Chloroflexota bacterium]